MLPSDSLFRWKLFLVLLSALFLPSVVKSSDWIHWRGPEQNGVSREKNLPDTLDPAMKAKGNVVWQKPFGGRSAPLVMDGRIYIINGHGYAHATAGLMMCFDGKTGKVVWQHSLTEEYGRISGYGGRIVTPIFDSGLVIVGMVNSSWGDQGRASNRFVAFDGKTGQVVWWGDTGTAIKGTYYSSPVVSVIGGQRLLITGGADGGLHAFKVRTGELVWSLPFGSGVINSSPIVSGNLVYCSHGEENPEGGPIGRVICVDASQIDPMTKKPKLVWEYRKGQRFGLASGALADGKLYLPDDTGELFCFDAKSGKVLWRYRYATEVRGAPLIADGKIYIFDVKGKLIIITPPEGNKQPGDDDVFEYRFRDPKGVNETNGTCIAVNGRVYFTTRTDLYCIGDPNAKPECGKYEELAKESEFKPNAIAGARIFPADVVLKPGETTKFTLVFVDANGREVKDNRPSPPNEWVLPTPPLPKGAKTGPPPLNGKIEGGTLTVGPLPAQQGYVDFMELGKAMARARVRVAPQTPYSQDFEKIPDGAAPGGWVNAQGKYTVVTVDGKKYLSKVNTDARPPFARANAYITGPTAASYTIQADMMGSLERGKAPDLGVVNSRYTLILDGKKDSDAAPRQVRLVSWEARPRVNVAVDFDWQPGTWYTVKLAIEQKEKTAVVRAKVWKAGEKEPEKWSLEFEDPSPNRDGAAALYGYVSNITPDQPGSNIYYDNVSVTPNK